jgi:hypothetical protein
MGEGELNDRRIVRLAPTERKPRKPDTPRAM